MNNVPKPPFLESHKWAGIGAIAGIIGTLVTIISIVLSALLHQSPQTSQLQTITTISPTRSQTTTPSLISSPTSAQNFSYLAKGSYQGGINYTTTPSTS